MNYTGDMKDLISQLKDHPNYNKDNYYLFFITDPKDNSLGGYMPFNKQFGFIFNNSIRTIAHEIGHGAFGLRHPFSQFTSINEGTTDNLMDYNNGTKLWKYQWELVQNPEKFINWLYEEGEAPSWCELAARIQLWYRQILLNSKCFVIEK